MIYKVEANIEIRIKIQLLARLPLLLALLWKGIRLLPMRVDQAILLIPQGPWSVSRNGNTTGGRTWSHISGSYWKIESFAYASCTNEYICCMPYHAVIITQQGSTKHALGGKMITTGRVLPWGDNIGIQWLKIFTIITNRTTQFEIGSLNETMYSYNKDYKSS